MPRLLLRGPRVHPRVMSFLTARNKLAAVVTRARVDPLVSVGMSFQLRAASAHHGLDNPPGQSWKLLFGRCFHGLIILIPKKNTMSQFVDSHWVLLPRGQSSECPRGKHGTRCVSGPGARRTSRRCRRGG